MVRDLFVSMSWWCLRLRLWLGRIIDDSGHRGVIVFLAIGTMSGTAIGDWVKLRVIVQNPDLLVVYVHRFRHSEGAEA